MQHTRCRHLLPPAVRKSALLGSQFTPQPLASYEVSHEAFFVLSAQCSHCLLHPLLAPMQRVLALICVIVLLVLTELYQQLDRSSMSGGTLCRSLALTDGSITRADAQTDCTSRSPLLCVTVLLQVLTQVLGGVKVIVVSIIPSVPAGVEGGVQV
jgi:hypothetical protein